MRYSDLRSLCQRRGSHVPSPSPMQSVIRFLCLAAFLTFPWSAHAATILGVGWDGMVVRIDSETGSHETVGSSGFSGLNSLARNSSGGFFSAAGNPLDTTAATLVTIDPLTGLGTAVTTLSGVQAGEVRALAFSSSDVLYAIRNGGGPFATTVADDLYTINVSTGLASAVGNTGLPGIQGLGFSSEDTLFGWDLNTTGTGLGLVTINSATGAATDVNALIGEGGISVQSVAFGSDGSLWGVHDALYLLDPSTGSATAVGSGGYPDLRGIESYNRAPLPVPAIPEPSSLLLLGVGIMGLIGLRRWRN